MVLEDAEAPKAFTVSSESPQILEKTVNDATRSLDSPLAVAVRDTVLVPMEVGFPVTLPFESVSPSGSCVPFLTFQTTLPIPEEPEGVKSMVSPRIMFSIEPETPSPSMTVRRMNCDLVCCTCKKQGYHRLLQDLRRFRSSCCCL